jgi:hypothetical protein
MPLESVKVTVQYVGKNDCRYRPRARDAGRQGAGDEELRARSARPASTSSSGADLPDHKKLADSELTTSSPCSA